MTNISKINGKSIVIFIIYVTLFCTYIFPTNIIDSTAVTTKLIFAISSLILYVIYFKKISIYDWLFLLLIAGLTIYTRRVNYLTFLSLPVCRFIINERDGLREHILKSNVLYVCLAFTLIYSVIYFGTDGKYAFSAIKEINQSGLAIYCLGIMLMQKNKKVGLFTLFLGMFTFSRSYLLALVIYLVFSTKLVKNILSKIKVTKISYLLLTILNTIIFVGLAYIYINAFKNGEIGMNDKIYKFINPFDYSNLFRFTAILYSVLIFMRNPKYLLFGLDEARYNALCNGYADNYFVPFRPTDPHNLLFSHLKIYGFVGIIETIFVSHLLKKIVTHENFHIFFSISLYSLILGAGLYSYWLYLSVLTMVVFSNSEKVQA